MTGNIFFLGGGDYRTFFGLGARWVGKRYTFTMTMTPYWHSKVIVWKLTNYKQVKLQVYLSNKFRNRVVGQNFIQVKKG